MFVEDSCNIAVIVQETEKIVPWFALLQKVPLWCLLPSAGGRADKTYSPLRSLVGTDIQSLCECLGLMFYRENSERKVIFVFNNFFLDLYLQ